MPGWHLSETRVHTWLQALLPLCFVWRTSGCVELGCQQVHCLSQPRRGPDSPPAAAAATPQPPGYGQPCVLSRQVAFVCLLVVAQKQHLPELFANLFPTPFGPLRRPKPLNMRAESLVYTGTVVGHLPEMGLVLLSTLSCGSRWGVSLMYNGAAPLS